ncbi:hypothetical protein SEPCBS119000_000928 [Sporothrix epigloea]|uniref:Uncharacterized protein n=1 Tax=Sporothrix epigloea TaxID=1892477 RepID=A0ABP0D7Y1_9PEZI
MHLTSLLGLLAASAVEASVCKLSKPSSVSSSASASPSSPPCNTNAIADPTTGFANPHDWQYSVIDDLAVSFPATCHNDAYNSYPDGSCVNLLLTQLPQNLGNGPWQAATITRTLPTVVGTNYYFGFAYWLGSDEPNANTGTSNDLICEVDNTQHTNGWAPFFSSYPEDTYLGMGIEFTATAAATQVKCTLNLDTTIDMTISVYYFSALCP